ncbi:hypothetical protein MPER_12417, partial [Moniliophthora perniciosa FA553]
VVCPWLLRDLVDLGLWDDNMKNMIIAHNGSVQNIPNIPDNVKAIYKTVWEISQKKVLDLAADRGGLHLPDMHFYGWKKGLKTGMYYLRTRPAAQAIQFTVDQSVLKTAKAQNKGTIERKVSTTTVSSAVTAVAAKLSPAPAAASTTVSITGPSEGGLPTPTSSTPEASPRPSSSPVASTSTSLESLSLDEKTRKAAEADPEFAAALQRQKDRELEEAKLMCSIENKEAYLLTTFTLDIAPEAEALKCRTPSHSYVRCGAHAPQGNDY